MKDFDREAFKKRCVYDEDLEKTIMEGSVSNIPEQIEKMNEAYQENDAYQLERAAHGLKGTAGTLSALQLQEAAKEIELSAKSGQIEEKVENLLSSIQQTYENFLATVKQEGLYNDES